MEHLKTGKSDDINNEACVKDAEWISSSLGLDMFTKYVLCSEIYIFYSESAQMTQHVQILTMYRLFILIYFTCVLDMAEYCFCVLDNFFILYISSTPLNSINNKM